MMLKPAAGAAPVTSVAGKTGAVTLDHTTDLANVGTNTHSAIDTFIASKAAASGLASLDASSLLVQAAQIIRESGGTSMTAGAVADGQLFIRSGSTYAGYAPRTYASSGDLTASTTSADFDVACATGIAATPTGIVSVFVNGLFVSVGSGVRTKDCYFSGNSGVTARSWGSIVSGDKLYWVGSVAGYQLASTDIITFIYAA